VIICNYNYDKYLGEAIESVIKQTYKNIELIIVDDGSSDNSRKIIESFNDIRITKIYQENSGQAAAFNAGFERCKGEYVAFLDSDDFWFPNKLEKTIPIFNNDNISIVQHNLVVIDEKSKKLGHSHPGLKPGLKNVLTEYFKKNHTGFFCPTSGVICRKKDLAKIFPLSPEWKICADAAFTRPLPIFGLVFTCKEDLGTYRIHNQNKWMNTERRQKYWHENQKKYCEYTNQWLKKFGITQAINYKKPTILKNLLNITVNTLLQNCKKFG